MASYSRPQNRAENALVNFAIQSSRRVKLEASITRREKYHASIARLAKHHAFIPSSEYFGEAGTCFVPVPCRRVACLRVGLRVETVKARVFQRPSLGTRAARAITFMRRGLFVVIVVSGVMVRNALGSRMSGGGNHMAEKRW
ncbi:uncharacterized protein BDZ99DRAFT_199168 [Mytilinidion resinicola]|uniref:Uncharacterized protein n=1 Tax=Mytilinidion resinicola TaxID=574789 RepID=A0A6A6Y3B2_9PEZI|nr:uncharacterized protein BDZ99DRAFT_199168 [Mytilinidion resinicola]KAF2802715.1 hypothetical protein BDZ99DRAFT_199168 [Mytilinidion resinicola]